MPFEKKIDSLEVYEFVKEFYEKYKLLPKVEFMAKYFKVTSMTISQKLKSLEKLGFIKRVKKNKYSTTYIIINRNI